MSDEEIKTKDFLYNNRITLDLANKVESYLKGYKWFSVTIIINCCTINLKQTKKEYQLNSNLIIDDAGYGKSSLLNMLYEYNKKHINFLPTKMYALELLKKGSDFFTNKILFHQDLSQGFLGLNKKSLVQLDNFFTGILSDHFYEQLNYKIEARCNAMMAIPKKLFVMQKGNLFQTTLLERITMLKNFDRTEDERKDILEFIDKQPYPPQIKLPINISKIKIDIKENIFNEINKISAEMEDLNIMSATRAKNYISNFLKSNTYINKRKTADIYDLELFKKVYPYHKGTRLTLYEKIKNHILENEKSENPKSDRELIKKINCSFRSFYKYKKLIVTT